MAIYLSSTTRQFFEYGPMFGCMFNIVRRTKRQLDALKAGCLWMLDNGNYTGKWTLELWQAELNLLRDFTSTCLGVILPDVVGNWEATLDLFYRYNQLPGNLGYKIAYATQDGQPVNRMPWHHIDTLFVGGTNEHKRGLEAERLGLAARERDKWVHIGRVNSGSAMIQHWPYADSYDGTTFSRHPTQQVESILNGLSVVNNSDAQQRKLL